MFIYNSSIFLTSTAFVATNAKYGIPLSRYTVLKNCPLECRSFAEPFLFVLHLSEFSGRDSVRLREFARKVKLVAKAENVADFFDRMGGVEQLTLGARHQTVVDVLPNRLS